jgi:hypothetical protein
MIPPRRGQDNATETVARGMLPPMVETDPKQPVVERIARAMAAVDGSAWEPLLPKARAAVAEFWHMMDNGLPRPPLKSG